MYDDLKDADMMIDYACDIKELNKEDEALAMEIAKYAQYRLNHFSEFHKLFLQEAQKSEHIDKKTVSDYMWEETHEHLKEWCESIKRKIEKF
jgi:hypothetical protein